MNSKIEIRELALRRPTDKTFFEHSITGVVVRLSLTLK